MSFTFSVPSILAALNDPFNPNLLLATLEEDAQLKKLFAADAGVWEGYTIRAHTLMVLGVFERFQAKWLTEHEKKFFRLFLALHDIGKPLAIEKTGDKKNQSQFTTPLVQAALEQCQLEQRWIMLAVELEKYDILGQYLKDQLTINEAQDQLKQISEMTTFSVTDVLNYLTVFYQSDAGAYTETAGGKYSLDFLFEFDESKQLMNFSVKVNSYKAYVNFSPDMKYKKLLFCIEFNSK